MRKRIAIVDDEPRIAGLFETVLTRDGYETTAYGSAAGLLAALDAGAEPDLVLTDLMMPGMDGLDLLRALKGRGFAAPVVMMTGHSSVQTAVDAMRLGALHYLQKPVNLEEMRALLSHALRLDGARRELDALRAGERARFGLDALRGTHPRLDAVREAVRTLATAPATSVLLRGETGTGKNLVARALHVSSPSREGRFLEINCAALPDNLLEAELFGFERGAFTDAKAAKPGLLEMADGGTVLLDEVDAMSPALQAKLLSFLENRTLRRLGAVEDLRVSTRVVCATNADLEALVAERAFRADLFYRIAVVSVEMPPLRSLGDDVLLLARDALEHFARELGRDVRGFTPAAEARLAAHPWPGNVRELRNVIERAVIFASGPVLDAPTLALATMPGAAGALPEGAFVAEPDGPLDLLEQAYIAHTLRRHPDASFTDIAGWLGISKKTLWEKRRRFNLDEVRTEG